MKILVRQARIADPSSQHHGQVNDILIDGSVIAEIAGSISTKADQVIEAEGLTVSPGWVDIFSHFCDPGYEYKETLETGAAAAAAGGYTQVFVLPETKPVIDSKSQVEYISRHSTGLAVRIHPLGAITKGLEGKELAEMYDMRNSGAIAFTDGNHPVQSPGLLVKALQYIKAFDGVLIQVPVDKSIGAGGLMTEGIVSTRLGLPGIPALAEEIMIKRDIDLLRYTGSRLHITAISTAKSLALVTAAKAEGLSISCSVTPYHLFFCDEDLQDYDTNLKVNPPLRSRADMMALRVGVLRGEVDCIATHHLPQDWDNKTCEFEYAKNGMTGLETAFAVINELFPALSEAALVKLFSLNARNIFNLPQTNIVVGAQAELSLFSKKQNTILQKPQIKSRSYNSPFIDKPLKGKVVGIINNGFVILT